MDPNLVKKVVEEVSPWKPFGQIDLDILIYSNLQNQFKDNQVLLDLCQTDISSVTLYQEVDVSKCGMKLLNVARFGTFFYFFIIGFVSMPAVPRKRSCQRINRTIAPTHCHQKSPQTLLHGTKPRSTVHLGCPWHEMCAKTAKMTKTWTKKSTVSRVTCAWLVFWCNRGVTLLV